MKLAFDLSWSHPRPGEAAPVRSLLLRVPA